MPSKTLWVSPTGWVSGDATLRLSYPSSAHPAVEVTATEPGDLKWVYLGLCLPPCSEILSVRVCYRLSNRRSFISQVRLTEMKTPERALVRHDDGTGLTSTDPTCYLSRVGAYRPDGAVTLQLRLRFRDPSDKITLGAAAVDLRSYGSISPLSDIRFSLQGRYLSRLDFSGLGVSNDALTIHGSALLAARETAISDFTASSQDEIREALEDYLVAGGIDTGTDHLMVLDLEPGETSAGRRRSYAPRALGTFEGDPLQEEIIAGYRTRIAAARQALPNAKLSLYQVVVPDGRGRESDAFLQRMRGYRRAGQLGMYDSLDLISPVLYTRFGPSDEDSDRGIDLDTIQGWIEASTRQAIESSLTLARSNGRPIPLAPFLGFWVANGNSRHHQLAVLPETMRLQMRIVEDYCAVEVIVMWSGPETPEEIRDSGREVIDLHDFLTRVGPFPLDP